MEQQITTAKPRTSPKDFFLHLGAVATLYLGIFNFLAIVFNIINVKFPDRLERYFDPYSSGMRFAIASLLVLFPLHLLLMWLLNRDYVADPEKRNIPFRKWLVWLTLAAAGVAIAVDLIWLLNSFLGGELTTRFVLKAVAVLAVAVAVFWYYLADLKRSRGLTAKGMKILSIVVTVIVVGTLIFGFTVMGSPMKLRQYRFDIQRVNDLQNIQYQVLNYWQSKQALPKNLDDLKNALLDNVVPMDPETGKGYEYVPGTGTSFKLCANFALASDSVTGTPIGDGRGGVMPMMDMTTSYPAGPGYDSQNTNWKHEAGRACFDRTIDPDLYPPREKVLR